MKNDTAHRLDEFKDFPWDKLTEAIHWWNNGELKSKAEFKVYGVSVGGVTAGVDFNRREPHIDFGRQDGSVDAWAIPRSLWVLIEEYEQRGWERNEKEIRAQVNHILSTVGEKSGGKRLTAATCLATSSDPLQS